MKKIFYKIELQLENKNPLPITLATTEINNIPSLIEKHKPLYQARGLIITGFKLVDTLYSISMSDEKYQEELSFCDIVDEQEGVTQGEIIYTGPSYWGNK